jgi:hypothetical protein
MRKHIRHMLILVSLMALASCQNIVALNNQQRGTTYSDICIPPAESFVYSVSPDYSKWPGDEGMLVPPNWQIETDIAGDFNLLLFRLNHNSEELWFSQYINNEYDPSTPWARYTRFFHVYDVGTRKMKTISAEVKGSGIFAQYLFVGPDGSIWAQNDIEIINTIPNGSNYSIVSRFDELSNEFEFVDEVQPILFLNKKDKGNVEKSVSTVIDKTGVLWFIVPEDAIYSYDPIRKETKKWAEIPELDTYSPIASFDGSVYFLSNTLPENGVPTTSDIRIFRFTPKTGQVELVFMRLDPWPLFASLLVDSQGRLWAGGLAYRDLNGGVYQLERSPIFLTNAMETGFDYRWGTPDILMESSDGRLWFRSRNGLAWLNLDEQKWCWLSTSLSRVVEDNHHNLWMTAYGKLYKTQIIPKK